LGRALSLSPLVVFVSMLLWYLIWGPIGAVLAVPITVATKVICSHVRGLERIAIVLKA
jgi:predicted PurR-regulated permease PerM